jgi:hypothetical protein
MEAISTNNADPSGEIVAAAPLAFEKRFPDVELPDKWGSVITSVLLVLLMSTDQPSVTPDACNPVIVEPPLAAASKNRFVVVDQPDG